MVESLPTMVDTHIKEQLKKQAPEQRGNIQAEISSQIQKAIDNHIPSQVDASVRSYMSGHILHVHPVQSQTPSVPEQQYQLYLSMKNDPQLQQQDIAIWLALQMKFENLQVSGESSSGQVNEEEQGPSTSGNQEQVDDYDFWTDSYASDDDEIPTKQVSQDIMEEVSLTIDEAKLKKMADEMLRQRCTSGDEHQYHIDQMKNFLKSDIVWESRKEILVSPHPRKTTPLNPHAKIFYIKKQKEPRKPKEEVYSNSKIIQVIKTYWELGHEHKFITEIVARIRIEKHKMFSIIYEPVHGIIYKNSKKEKRVMRHSEIHKFCDATLNRVLEGLKSYNNDVKYGYVQRELTNDEVEYLKLFEEEIEVRLKYRNQMRRWEMYVNGRPLGPRRERPE
ncbi:hypothetical protein Tco_1243232 [Tanacetum coccineum]